MNNVNEYGISIYGDFTDKALEKDFFNHEIGKTIKHIRPIILALGLLFMLFIIPDYFLIKNKDTFNIILSIRTGALLLILILYYSLRRIKNYIFYAVWVTALEIIISIAYMAIYYFYESPDYLIQAMGVIIIVIGIYLAPNKWIYMQIAAIITAAAFTVVSFCFRQETDISEFRAGIAYILLVMLLSSISSYRANYYKRVQYVDSKKLMVMSQTDSLTGLFNRARFNDELIKWVSYSDRYKTPISLAIFDIDDFKLINDKYGHLSGDMVMTETIDAIKGVIRQSDVFARWGGDEFVLLLPNTETTHAMELVERIRNLVDSRISKEGHHITCSFGLASLQTGENAEHVLQRADELLYQAKEKGKNTVAFQM